jgi:hypothetical protein
MTILGGARAAAVLVLLLGLSACAERAGGGTAGPSEPSTAQLPADGLVLRVEYTGGFVMPSTIVSRLPMVSLYADGRLISEGPVAAIYPGPALPNVQVRQLDPAEVQALADEAVAAGVTETGDLGQPPIADAPNTRFTLVTASGTSVREVPALFETPEGSVSGVSEEQAAARAELSEFLGTLTDMALASTEPYVPDAMAAVATPWADPGDGLTPPEVPWPGPPLPGESTGAPLDVSCVTADAGQTAALLAAAADANAATPWVTPDGSRWSVVFRPLLPDETGCADLTD